MEKYEIVKFVDNEFELDVRTDKDNDTVWLNTDDIAVLFDRDYTTIRRHINNALKEELDEKVVVAKFASTTKHGAMKDNVQTHDVNFYNLNLIRKCIGNEDSDYIEAYDTSHNIKKWVYVRKIKKE